MLLELLRFGGAAEGRRIRVVHVDHRMRPGSGRDAAWLRGLCGAWGVPFEAASPKEVPTTEAEARRARYRAFRTVVRRRGSAALLLAHHAGDQAETVLLRLLRGTGPRGLAGIPPRRLLTREVPVVRPLLCATPAALERRARRRGLRPREDETNRDPRWARNRVRHEILPRLEAGAPGTTELLLALSREARQREEALAAVLERLDPGLVVRRRRHRDGGAPRTVVVDRDALLRLPPALRGEALRGWGRELGVGISGRGLALALAFVERAESGRCVVPAPTIRIERSFGELHLARDAGGARAAGRGAGDAGPVGTGQALRIPGGKDPGNGAWEGEGGERVRVAWGPGGPDPAWGFRSGAPRATFPVGWLRFPLEVRRRRPGDRVRWAAGEVDGGSGPATRRLKKLLIERRVSRETRWSLPLLVDGEGLVIWIPGVWRCEPSGPGANEDPWSVGVDDERDDP